MASGDMELDVSEIALNRLANTYLCTRNVITSLGLELKYLSIESGEKKRAFTARQIQAHFENASSGPQRNQNAAFNMLIAWRGLGLKNRLSLLKEALIEINQSEAVVHLIKWCSEDSQYVPKYDKQLSNQPQADIIYQQHHNAPVSYPLHHHQSNLQNPPCGMPVQPIDDPHNLQSMYAVNNPLNHPSVPHHNVINPSVPQHNVINPSVPQTAATNVYHAQINSDDSGVYKMESIPRGLMLIINNKNFNYAKERKGTDEDAQRLWDLFSHQLGFDVIRKDDLTKQQMLDCMNDMRQNPILSEVDSLVIAILSYGSENGIYGVDGMPKTNTGLISVKQIIGMFDADKDGCPLMKAKPKLFILQACRGSGMDRGIVEDDALGNNASGGAMPPTSDMETLSLEDIQHVRHDINKQPHLADILIGYPTSEGTQSLRHSLEGSWYVNDLCDVIEEYRCSEHMLDIMTKVNNKVTQRHDPSKGRVQMPTPSFSLRKKWYLNPPDQ